MALNEKFVHHNLVEKMPVAKRALPESNVFAIMVSAVIHMSHVMTLTNAMPKLVEKMQFVSIHPVHLIVNVNRDTREIHLSCARLKKPKFVTIREIVDVVRLFYVHLIMFAARDYVRICAIM